MAKEEEKKKKKKKVHPLVGAGMALCGHAPWPSLSGADCVALTFQKAENAEGQTPAIGPDGELWEPGVSSCGHASPSPEVRSISPLKFFRSEIMGYGAGRVPLGPLGPPPFLAPTPQTAHTFTCGCVSFWGFFCSQGCYFFLSSFFKNFRLPGEV